MKVCASCEHEFDESAKFCPECGHQFGVAGAQQAERLNRGLQQMVQSAERERSLERAASSGPLNVNPNFELSPSTREKTDMLTKQMIEGGRKGTDGDYEVGPDGTVLG